MKKKDNKVARKEIQKERPRKKDQNRKEVHILAYAHVPKTKMKLNYFILLLVAGNHATVLKILFLGIFKLNWQKIAPKKRFYLKSVFFSLLIINIPYSKGYFLVIISTCMFTG